MTTDYDWRDFMRTAADHDARQALQREVVRLGAEGLRPRDIGATLGLNDHDVIKMLSDEQGAR